MTMDVSHGREIFMKCSEIFMKCSAVTGSFAINFAGVSFCSLSTLISFSKHGGQYLSPAATGPKPGWPGQPFLSIHRFISFPKPAPPPSTLSSLLLCWRQVQPTALSRPPAWDAARLNAGRSASGLRLHLHPAEISITISVSKQHKLGCLELGSNTATDLLRWAGGPQAVPQHQLVQDAFPIPRHGPHLSLPRSLPPILLPCSQLVPVRELAHPEQPGLSIADTAWYKLDRY